MSQFNPEVFLGTQYNAPTDSKYIPVPAMEYPAASVADIKVRTNIGDEQRTVMDITWEILDDTARQVTGMEHPSARQGIFLDLTPEGALDMGKGKNVALGRLREALKQNGPQPWSPMMMKGGMARVVVEHVPSKKGDGDIFANVTRVSAI